MTTPAAIATFFLLFFSFTAGGRPDSCWPDKPPAASKPVCREDVDLLQFALNLEFLEAEFFLYGSRGRGLDAIAPQLALGGPPPIGAAKAKLDPVTRRLVEEFGLQEVGHLRAIQSTVGGFARPLLDLSCNSFGNVFDMSVGYHLSPPLNPYKNTINFLLASYLIPYMGLVGYVGANPSINGYKSKRLLAGLLGVESGQDAVIRARLYDRAGEIVEPYNLTVAYFTSKISDLRNRLAGCGVKDEGLLVELPLGAEKRTTSNVLSANAQSLSYARTPAEILRVVYGTGSEHRPGGFYPEGGNGRIAREYLWK